MASTLQDRLLEIFTAIAGPQTRFPERSTGASPTTPDEKPVAAEDSASPVLLQAVQLQSRSSSNSAILQPAAFSADTLKPSIVGEVGKSLLTNSVASLLSPAGGVVDAVKQLDESGGGAVKTLESIATKVFSSGFGLVSLFGGLFGLFGSSGQEEPTPLMKYALPPRIDFQAAETAGGLVNVDYDQTGMPRASNSYGHPGSSGGGPAITVNVQALDARSFLDRSGDIAAAVRDAMLNLNSINDVVNEL